MMKKNRLSAILLSICMLIALTSVHAVAEEPAEETGEKAQEYLTEIPPLEAELAFEIPDCDGRSTEELLNAYAQRELDSLSYRQKPLYASRNLGDELAGPNAVLYREHKAQIARIASGVLSSTVVEVDSATLFGKTSFSSDELGVDIVKNGNINSEAVLAVSNQINIRLVVSTLMLDCPYEFYWFDKTYGYRYGFEGSYTVDSTGALVIPASYVVYYFVCGDCAPDGEEHGFETDPTIGRQVRGAVSNIRAVVDNAAGLDDLSKLKRYRQEICDRVSYNYSAANGGYSYQYGNPWQLIWVFDGDNSTNVVCEGYAKAFQYLCDLSDLAAVSCYTVYGETLVKGSSDGHMWNIVRMPDGKNYLADITNCDDNTVGSPDLLFLKGYSSTEGSMDGCDIAYCFDVGNGEVGYRYDADMYTLFSANDLLISNTDYNSAAPAVIPDDSTCDGKLPASLNCLEDEALAGCTFHYVKLPESVTTIGRRAFADCPNLAYVYIPENTIAINQDAFDGVTGLTILGKSGSYAESFAQSRGFAFVALNSTVSDR